MKKVIIVLVVVGLIAAGAFALYRARAQRSAAALQSLETVPLARGQLVASVGATGSVRANQTAQLPWQTSGTVAAVYPVVGDQVAEGETLAELRDTSLPQSVIQAAVELVNAQKTLADLLEPASALSLSQAEQAITQSEKQVRDLEDRVKSLKSTGSQTDIDQARATVVLAANKLDKARQDYEPYANKSEDNLVRATLLSVLTRAQQEYDNAVARLNNLLGTANAIDLAAAEADLDLAKAQLDDNREKYQKLMEGADPDDVAAARARVAAAQATVDLKQISAPFAGTITNVQARPGDQVSPGSIAFRLDDLSRLLVDVQVSEVDINNIRQGQNVVLTFDAIPAKEYHGVVDEVAEVGTPVEGVVDFIVAVALEDADEEVKPGMTAAVNVAVQQLDDVLLLPNRAVRVLNGQRVVYVLKDGVPQPVDISLGASSENYSELVSGDLAEGDPIVLNPPVVFEQNGPPPFVQQR
jgi:HlyD family secretion protein